MMLRDNFTPCENSIRLDNKVALVVGSTSSAGFEAATELARRGARVNLAGHNAENLAAARKRIVNVTGNENVVGRRVDFESLKSIRTFVHEMYIQEPRLNILINNVGAIGLEDRRTEDDLHVMMQVNYFGAFLLTFLLFPLLQTSAPSRIINVSSAAQFAGLIDLDHWNDVGRHWNSFLYMNAKLAHVLFTVEMSRRIDGSGVSVFSWDPGFIRSNIFRSYENLRSFTNSTLFLIGEPDYRVATSYVWLATDPELVRSSGKHYRNCEVYPTNFLAEDAQLTRKVWEVSKKLVKIRKDEDWELRRLRARQPIDPRPHKWRRCLNLRHAAPCQLPSNEASVCFKSRLLGPSLPQWIRSFINILTIYASI